MARNQKLTQILWLSCVIRIVESYRVSFFKFALLKHKTQDFPFSVCFVFRRILYCFASPKAEWTKSAEIDNQNKRKNHLLGKQWWRSLNFSWLIVRSEADTRSFCYINTGPACCWDCAIGRRAEVWPTATSHARFALRVKDCGIVIWDRGRFSWGMTTSRLVPVVVFLWMATTMESVDAQMAANATFRSHPGKYTSGSIRVYDSVVSQTDCSLWCLSNWICTGYLIMWITPDSGLCTITRDTNPLDSLVDDPNYTFYGKTISGWSNAIRSGMSNLV